MSSFRERVLGDEEEDTRSAVQLALNDFFPLFGAISLLPMLINAENMQSLTQATSTEAIAIVIGTATTMSLFLFAASSLQTATYGRYIAGSLLASLILLMIAVPQATLINNRFGLYFDIIVVLGIDLFGN